MVTQTLDILVKNIGLVPKIRAVQGDSGRLLQTRIVDMVIPTGTTARIYAEKPSGAKIYNDCEINENIVNVELTTQFLAETGTIACQVELLQREIRVTSFDFFVIVEKSRVDGAAIESENEFTALENTIEVANSAIHNANTAADNANLAADSANQSASAANTAAESASNAAESADAAAEEATQAASAANTAAEGANNARETLENKLAAGELSATVTVGTTATSDPGGTAVVTNSGDDKDVILNFTIPRGATGPQGPKGDSGSIENISEQAMVLSPSDTISENDDLNDYTDFGNWLCPSAAVTNSLSNSPVTGGGFSLRVMRGTSGAYRVQEIVDYSGRRWFRVFTGASWSSWSRAYTNQDTLPIANGGTGATTAAAARNALGLGNTAGALPIANGGTGATTAAAARSNLGVLGYTTDKPAANLYFNGNRGGVKLASNGHGLLLAPPADSGTDYQCVVTPLTNGGTILGSGTYRMFRLYATQAENVSSDRRIKDDFTEFDERFEDMFLDLKPMRYTLKASNEIQDENGDPRLFHSGLIAQDIGEALEIHGIDESEFLGYEHDVEDDTYSLVYTEFIPLAIHMIQKLQREIEILKEEIHGKQTDDTARL